MCYAIPGKIVRIQGDTAIVYYDGVRKKANVSLVKAKKGDYVLVHAGFAIQTLEKKNAEESLATIRQAIQQWKK